MNSLPPTAQAMKDFKGGLGFDDNPYQKDSADYIQYQEKIHALLSQELKDLNQEILAGI